MRLLALLGAVGAAVLVMSAAPVALGHAPSPSATHGQGAMEDMPGMTADEHAGMTHTTGAPASGEQGAMDPDMPGMQHDAPAVSRPRFAVLGGFAVLNASLLIGGLAMRLRKR
jgi:hypothetical protein